MKKIFLFSIFIVIALFQFLLPNDIVVNANSIKFARVNSSGCYLYRTATLNPQIGNIWCELENSYFVEIVSDYNDNFYKVNYNSIIGFAYKKNINEVVSVPSNPFPSGINVSINSQSGCYMRSSPISKTTTNNIIKTLDKGTKNILFIGYVHGDESVDLKGNLWYLVKYGTDIGYIYSDYVESKVTIYPNLEEINLLNNNYSSTLINPLTNTTTLIIVVSIMIPCLIILILLFCPKPKTSKIRDGKTDVKVVDINELTDIYNDVDI